MSEPEQKPHDPDDLELATTQDLLAELASRFDNSVFMGHSRQDRASSRCFVKVSGDTITCRGMIDVLYRRIEEMDDDLIEMEDDDDDD